MKHLKRIVIVIIALIQIQALMAQTDSIVVESTTENIEESDFNKKREYKYIDVNYIEEKTLFKLGFSPLEDLKIENINTTFSIEQKIIPSVSIILDNHYAIHKYSNSTFWDYSTGIGVRFYYSMNKRMKQSKGVNNFNSNYFSLKLDHFATYYHQDIPGYNSGSGYGASGSDPFKWTRDWQFRPVLKMEWGMQRRAGRWGFIDAGPYISYQEFITDEFSKSTFSFGLNLSLGFGLGL